MVTHGLQIDCLKTLLISEILKRYQFIVKTNIWLLSIRSLIDVQSLFGDCRGAEYTGTYISVWKQT